MTAHEFDAELYLWDARSDSWVFADLPFDIADEIEDAQTGPRRGFGAVRVEVNVGATTWRTTRAGVAAAPWAASRCRARKPPPSA